MPYRDEPPRRIQWEHKVAEMRADSHAFGAHGFDRDALQKALSEFGEEGWELVTTSTYERDGDTMGMLIFLKRPKH